MLDESRFLSPDEEVDDELLPVDDGEEVDEELEPDNSGELEPEPEDPLDDITLVDPDIEGTDPYSELP